jgi:glycosyltransferase involved in cell wall biosynthesis
MRILINATSLLSPRSGVGNYVYYMARTLRDVSNGTSYGYFYGMGFSSDLREKPSATYVESRKVVRRMGAVYPLYRKALDLMFRARRPWKAYDLYHEPNFIPLPFDGPTVLSVPDLSVTLFPETHPSERVRLMETRFYPRLHRVNHFLTISHAVKKEMIEHLRLPEEKITVTHLGVDARFAPMTEGERDTILARYGLKGTAYILSVGTLEPRKNLVTLLGAYAAISPKTQERHPLVLAGGQGWLMDDLDQRVQSLGLSATVRRIGYVPDADLPALYGGAVVFVYPSLYEGFGLPPLEAMACGTPVIVSNVSSLPEVVGDAGIQVEPKNVAGWTGAMRNVLEDDTLRTTLRNRGLEQAKQFSWEKCARETHKVYEKCLGKTLTHPPDTLSLTGRGK